VWSQIQAVPCGFKCCKPICNRAYSIDIILKCITPYFTIYPNPSCNNITIETSENLIGNHVYIYNAFGQVVLAQNINLTKEVIEMKALCKGIYFIKLNGDSAVQKLIID
jgi:hypothetical protein